MFSHPALNNLVRLADAYILNIDMYSCIIAECLKITEKVSFNVASKASYVYILSGQKFIEKPEVYGQTELPDKSLLIEQKLMENAKIQMRHFVYFSNTVIYHQILEEL